MIRMRAFCLLLLFLFVAAFVGCADDGSPKVPEKKPEKTPIEKKPEHVADPTGLPQIQKAYDMWAKIVAAEEKKKKPDRSKRTAEQAVRGCEFLIKVLQISIKEDAKFSAKFRHADMRRDLTHLRREKRVLLHETDEINAILHDADKKVAPIPAGFTRAELEDKLTDIKKAMAKLDERLKEHLETMTALEKALNSGATPEQGETLAKRELAAVLALKKRAEALR